jgi:hypothetical protein
LVVVNRFREERRGEERRGEERSIEMESREVRDGLRREAQGPG